MHPVDFGDNPIMACKSVHFPGLQRHAAGASVVCLSFGFFLLSNEMTARAEKVGSKAFSVAECQRNHFAGVKAFDVCKK